MNEPFGFLVIDKPQGITSHDCVNVIRKIFKTKRVGHGGTLDPSVTGVLPIAVGNATRLFQYLPSEKTYIALIQLGKKTFTDDINGEIILEKKWPLLEESFINKILNDFRGVIQQKPPLISSIHYQGERAYKRARKGEKFDLPMREITIYKLKLCSWDQKSGCLELIIHCSAGTYIRAIARDLGEKLNCGGCLLGLRRIQAQGFEESRSIPLPKSLKDNDKKPQLINPIEALNHLNKIQLITKEEIDSWRKGQQIKVSEDLYRNSNISNNLDGNTFNQYTMVIDTDNNLAGIGFWSMASSVRPKVVFNAYS